MVCVCVCVCVCVMCRDGVCAFAPVRLTVGVQEARIALHFAEEVSFGCIKVWNYSKTPSRGARNIQVFVDCLVIFEGCLRPAPAAPSATSFAEMIPFTDAHALRTSADAVSTDGDEQDVQFTNDREVVIPWQAGQPITSGRRDVRMS
jgi:protein JBTS26